MANVFETIENSAVIQNFKAQYNAAAAAGDSAGMAAAHAAANAYREQVGGYTDVYKAGEGTKYTRVITNAENYNSALAALNSSEDKKEDNSSSSDDVLTAVKKLLNENKPVTIIDSEQDKISSGDYDPAAYSVNFTESNTSFDDVLGYGLIGLLGIAILSRIVGGM